MAEKYSSLSHSTNPPQQTPELGKASVYTMPDTAQDAPKGKVGVYDRPERTFGSWSPMIIISLILGVLLLLWVLGIFDYLLR
jgi:hypothetical protein